MPNRLRNLQFVRLRFSSVTKFVLLLEVVTCILFSDLFNSIDSIGSVVQEEENGISNRTSRGKSSFFFFFFSFSLSMEFDVTRTVGW